MNRPRAYTNPIVALGSGLLLAVVISVHGEGRSLDRGLHATTYCNPLPIPNYPIGRATRSVINGERPDDSGLWLLEHKEQFRELADPTALWLDGKWYLYPSVDMGWVSADNGATWQHYPLNIRDVGYAPTVVKHGGRFLLLASGSELYAADSPLGDFVKLGRIRLPADAKAPPQIDPMLFSDDDGRLYYYFGCSKAGGIWAVELDAKIPTNAVGKPLQVIPFRPDAQPWEAVGEWNEDTNTGWLEGAWMLKRKGRYYLTFSAAGTQYRTYAMGCYTSRSPLGPFEPQKRNPILRCTDGLVTGTGHGCIVAGPQDELWVFYTMRAGVAHGFERRLGMDRAAIDANGELFVPAATSRPQWLPGEQPSSGNSAPTDWLPLNGGQPTFGSTSTPDLPGRFAVDNEIRTWWQPAAGDAQPTLTSRFNATATVRAVRIIWRDVGMDTGREVKPGPFRYRVELETEKDKWTTILDRSDSREDFLVDYRECAPVIGMSARLEIVGWPEGITPSVAEFTVFGKTQTSAKGGEDLRPGAGEPAMSSH